MNPSNRSRKSTLVLLWTTCTVLLAAFPEASADDGNGGGLQGNRLEGENYDTADLSCIIDLDNENPGVHNDTSASGGQVAFIPHETCSIVYDDVFFPQASLASNFRVRFGGADNFLTLTGFVIELHLIVDGATAAVGHFRGFPADGWFEADFSAPTVIAPGSHSIRIQYVVLVGWWYLNLYVDFVDFEFLVGPYDHDDGSCTIYQDADHDGQVDDQEAQAGAPCPDVRTHEGSDGSLTVYDDKDDDGVADNGEVLLVTPPSPDQDGDGVVDSLEPTLCANENANFNFEGTCVGDDYSPATPEGLIADIEKLLE